MKEFVYKNVVYNCEIISNLKFLKYKFKSATKGYTVIKIDSSFVAVYNQFVSISDDPFTALKKLLDKLG